MDSAPVAAAKQAGGRLFDAVFSGPVGECLRRSLDRAQDAGATLRIRLRLSDCPDLADLPWELLYDRSEDWFLALSGSTPVVRYIHLPVQPRPVRAELPLRILVIRSEPAGLPRLDLDAEWSHVAVALAELRDGGMITTTELAAPTLGELRRVLLRDTFNVLHFMGHGGFDDERGGFLLFTNGAGQGVPVTATDLGVLLKDHASMRLATINACQAGRTDPHDPFAGVADALIRRGIPAVIAMQFDVSDMAAVEFAPALYGALATGRPVDVAVAEARKAIYTVSPVEWATPVLYLRADNARLFEIPQAVRPLGSAQTRSQTSANRDPGNDHAGSGATQRASHVHGSTMSGDGVHVVGLDIRPGVYRTAGPKPKQSGYYALLNSTDTGDIISNHNFDGGPATITVGPDVKAVDVSSCQPWHWLGENLQAAIDAANLDRRDKPFPSTMSGDGVHVVGLDIRPGVYRTAGPKPKQSGYYALLNSTDTGDIISNHNFDGGPATITVGPDVKAVDVSSCQPWHWLGENLQAAIDAANLDRRDKPFPSTMSGDGVHVVGLDIRPGVYRTAGPEPKQSGYYALLNSTDTGDIISNHNFDGGPATITVGPDVKAVDVSSCQPWHWLGENLQAAVNSDSPR